MDIELYMIKAWYDHSEKPEQKLLPIKDIDVGEQILMKTEREWVVPNHYRSQNQQFIRQIGIRFTGQQDVENVWITSPDQQSKREFIYHSQIDIWFEPTLFTDEKERGVYQFDESVILTGIANAGTAELTYSENGTVHHLATIHFVPSSLTMEDYEEMVADLYQIREDLVRDDRNVAKVVIKHMEMAENLEENLNSLTKAIRQIDANPHAVLQLQTIKKKPYSHGRFDLRMEMEKYMNPGKTHYRSRSLQPVTATYENKLIKQMLTDLVRYSRAMGSTELTNKSLVRHLRNERDMYFRKSDIVLQRLLGSVENIEDAATYEKVHSKLARERETYLEEERRIKNRMLESADFNMEPPKPAGTKYVEMLFDMNGMFDANSYYEHHQSSDGMKALIKYDRQQPPLTNIHYCLEPDGPRKRPNSHFGKIILGGDHVLSHAKFQQIFCEDAQIASLKKKKQVKISGFVRPQPNGIDAVSTPGPDIFDNYTFDFVQIISIFIDGEEMELDEQALEHFVENELPVKTEHAAQSEDAFMRFKQLEKLKALTDTIQETERAGFKFDGLTEAAKQLLDLPLFSSLKLQERLPATPTQLFLHNPVYRVAWQAIKAIKNSLSASLYVKQSDRQVSTGKVQHIFEVWSFYKMIHLLTKDMKWKLKNRRNLTSYLDGYLLDKIQNGPDRPVVLHRDDWELELYYEPHIDLTNGNHRTPDYVFIFKKNNVPKGMAILDAKYRNYVSQGKQKWKEDVVETAIDKYAKMQPTDEKWQVPLLASGILHSDMVFSENAEEEYHPYHVMYNEELFATTLTEEEPHKYASIYMTPSSTYVFKNWFRLIMEYHLNEYKVCWNCGETEVEERQLLTQYGYPKFYYTCTSCGEFWVKVHCQSKRHKIIKHMNNYHLQIKNQERWWVICPSCGDGRPPSTEELVEDSFTF